MSGNLLARNWHIIHATAVGIGTVTGYWDMLPLCEVATNEVQ
jgi:hypothetical protein